MPPMPIRAGGESSPSWYGSISPISSVMPRALGCTIDTEASRLWMAARSIGDPTPSANNGAPARWIAALEKAGMTPGGSSCSEYASPSLSPTPSIASSASYSKPVCSSAASSGGRACGAHCISEGAHDSSVLLSMSPSSPHHSESSRSSAATPAGYAIGSENSPMPSGATHSLGSKPSCICERGRRSARAANSTALALQA
eukprot:100385-Chlamydomonas_euryale.AAC.10